MRKVGSRKSGQDSTRLYVASQICHFERRATAPCSRLARALRRAAGVERVFSAAGKMHDNLRKSMKDSTLEHSLFAAFNIE